MSTANVSFAACSVSGRPSRSMAVIASPLAAFEHRLSATIGPGRLLGIRSEWPGRPSLSVIAIRASTPGTRRDTLPKSVEPARGPLARWCCTSSPSASQVRLHQIHQHGVRHVFS